MIVILEEIVINFIILLIRAIIIANFVILVLILYFHHAHFIIFSRLLLIIIPVKLIIRSFFLFNQEYPNFIIQIQIKLCQYILENQQYFPHAFHVITQLLTQYFLLSLKQHQLLFKFQFKPLPIQINPYVNEQLLLDYYLSSLLHTLVNSH